MIALQTHRFPTAAEHTKADGIYASLTQTPVTPFAAYLAFCEGRQPGRSALVMAMGGDAPSFDEDWLSRLPGTRVDLPGAPLSDEQLAVDEAVLAAEERAAWGRAPGDGDDEYRGLCPGA